MSRALRPCGGAARRQQRRWITLQQSEERMNVRHMDLMNKLPSLMNHRMPDREQFTLKGAPRHLTVSRRSSLQSSHYRVLRKVGKPEADPRLRPVAVATFEEMGLSPTVVNGLLSLGVSVPSNIQSLTIPQAVKGTSCMICAGTGSGKTLAFLTPMFQRMVDDRDAGLRLRRQRPRSIVLGSSFELTHQLWGVASRLGARLGMRVVEVIGGMPKGAVDAALSNGADMLVTTPTSLLRLVEDGKIVLSDVKSICFDEADLTFGGSYNKDRRSADLQTLLEVLRPLLLKQFERDSFLGRHKVQVLLSSNSVTRAYESLVTDWVPHARRCFAQSTHVAPEGLNHRFQLIAQRDKLLELRGVLGDAGVRPNPAYREAQERNKRDFWFPDAITFRTGRHSPLDEASWIRRGARKPQAFNRMATSTTRTYYLESYGKEYARECILPASTPRLLLPSATPASEVGTGAPLVVQKPRDAITAVRDKESFSAADDLVPVLPAPSVFFGPVRLTAAPFTALPGLVPQPDPAMGARTIVFVRLRKTLRFVANQLAEAGYRVAALGGKLGHGGHARRVAEFERWATGEANVLVATEVAARGLDHGVALVVNYDMPMHASDYLQMAGRAGRMGRAGHVVSLVDKNKRGERAFARHLEHALAKSAQLTNLAAETDLLHKEPIQVFWKNRRRKLLREYTRLQRRGFVTLEEERRLQAQTVFRAYRPPQLVHYSLYKQPTTNMYKMEERLMALTHQDYATTRGTGSHKLMGSPVKLLKSTLPMRGLTLTKNGRKSDPRGSLLRERIGTQRKKALRFHYGPYMRPMPIGPTFKGILRTHAVSQYPNQYGDS